jgi:hypothetical protein
MSDSTWPSPGDFPVPVPQYAGHQTSGGEITFPWCADQSDHLRERAAMPIQDIPEAIRMYDHLSPIEAILLAWTDPGPYPEWHTKMRRQVHALMPVLAHNLERLEATSRG